ncbi:MAG: hypothetical protein SPL34_02720 [Selenomonadaceae bacterium]|uniref:hypothetical protein n=1 Tax=Selenomonas bovis TaxID=416586 RepID=UPI002A93CA80|nr:hypothetical protein [Selenomonadaceae bacterium]
MIHHQGCQVCRHCGDTTYTNEVAERLEAIVASLRRTLAEIAVVDYESRPAA